MLLSIVLSTLLLIKKPYASTFFIVYSAHIQTRHETNSGVSELHSPTRQALIVRVRIERNFV